MGNVMYMRKGATHHIDDPHTLLLIHGDAIKDASPHNVPLTNSGAAVAYNAGRFGETSIEFSGGAKISMPGFTFYGDFTIEAWVRPVNLTFDSFILNGDNDGSVMFVVRGKPKTFGIGQKRISWDSVADYGRSIEWVHVAVARKNDDLMLFRNGELLSTVKSNTQYDSAGGNAFIGADGVVWYDEIRISDVARWTSDFTPPTKPYV